MNIQRASCPSSAATPSLLCFSLKRQEVSASWAPALQIIGVVRSPRCNIAFSTSDCRSIWEKQHMPRSSVSRARCLWMLVWMVRWGTERRAVCWPVSRVCRRCPRAWAGCWTPAAARGETWRGCTSRRPWSRTTWAEAGTTRTICWPTNPRTWMPPWLCSGKRW